jgi:hypothetical protein
MKWKHAVCLHLLFPPFWTILTHLRSGVGLYTNSGLNSRCLSQISRLESELEFQKKTLLGIRIRTVRQHPLRVVGNDLIFIGWSFGWDRKNQGPESQQTWHDKIPTCWRRPWAPSMGIFLQFGDVFIWVKYYRAERKTTDYQSIDDLENKQSNWFQM